MTPTKIKTTTIQRKIITHLRKIIITAVTITVITEDIRKAQEALGAVNRIAGDIT